MYACRSSCYRQPKTVAAFSVEAREPLEHSLWVHETRPWPIVTNVNTHPLVAERRHDVDPPTCVPPRVVQKVADGLP
jgi:hypothetical protein